jgi:uncharacterized protein (TIGR02118 family)
MYNVRNAEARSQRPEDGREMVESGKPIPAEVRMLKVTVLYGHPASPEDFEKYYEEVHGPIAAKMNSVVRFELTKFTSGPDGGRPAFYRMAELHFETEELMKASLASPEGRATLADLPNFATGGATILVGVVED